MSASPDEDRCHPELPTHVFLSSPPPPSTNLPLGRRNSPLSASPPEVRLLAARRAPDIFPPSPSATSPVWPRAGKALVSLIPRAHLFGLPGGAATACIPMWGRNGSAGAARRPSRTPARPRPPPRPRRLPPARCRLHVVTSIHLKPGDTGSGTIHPGQQDGSCSSPGDAHA